jgi:uncharacterized protein (TIGR02231 family)
MRRFPIIVFSLLFASTAGAAEIEARSDVDAAIVYPDGATVTRLVRVELPAGDTTLILSDFPPGLDPASLRVEGETGARLVIGAIDARPPKAVPPVVTPELEKKIEAARDQHAALEDKIAAETAHKNFAARFSADVPLGLGEKGEARPLTEWRAAFVAVSEEIAAADSAIRDLKLAQREVDREIARLEAQLRTNPPRKLEVRVDLTADAPTTGTLRVSYAMSAARWVPLYDARLETGGRERKASLELVRRAEIVQQTGEDWNNVALSVSTVRTGKGGNAPDLAPLIVRLLDMNKQAQQPRSADEPALANRPMPQAGQSATMSEQAPQGRFRGTLFPDDSEKRLDLFAAAQQDAAPAQERETNIETGGFQVLFRIPGRVSIAAHDGAKSLRIATATIAPELMVRSAPALDPTAFLEASFKHAEEAPLLPGRVALYRDGTFVGRGRLALAAKDETVNLGFGADDQIKVARIVQRKIEGSSGLISSSKTDERAFRITVRNGHDWPVKVVVEDRHPVSEITDVQVELLPGTTKPTSTDARDRRGVLAWTMDLKAGEARDIAFGWRIRWPTGKTVVFDQPGS